MKEQTAVSSLKKRMTHVLIAFCAAALPSAAIFAQGGPPSAGNPDEVVPFDPNMNLAFLAIGLVFAVVVVLRQLNKKAVTNKS